MIRYMASTCKAPSKHQTHPPPHSRTILMANPSQNVPGHTATESRTEPGKYITSHSINTHEKCVFHLGSLALAHFLTLLALPFRTHTRLSVAKFTPARAHIGNNIRVYVVFICLSSCRILFGLYFALLLIIKKIYIRGGSTKCQNTRNLSLVNSAKEVAAKNVPP